MPPSPPFHTQFLHRVGAKPMNRAWGRGWQQHRHIRNMLDECQTAGTRVGRWQQHRREERVCDAPQTAAFKLTSQEGTSPRHCYAEHTCPQQPTTTAVVPSRVIAIPKYGKTQHAARSGRCQKRYQKASAVLKQPPSPPKETHPILTNQGVRTQAP